MVPQYLRSDSIRLLEAAVEALELAIVGLYLPKRQAPRTSLVQYAPIIGLAGASAELAMSACLVQTFGSEALFALPNRYKTGREVLADFRGSLRNPVPRANFLTTGVQDPQSHRDQLVQFSEGFTLLITCRAAGLHAGAGPSRDATLLQAKRVHDFLNRLAKSSRIRPYLTPLPCLPEPAPEIVVLAEDLLAQIRGKGEVTERAAALNSLFLVLPEVPNKLPDWLDAFERVNVAPRDEDIGFLLTVLERAVNVQIRRATRTGPGLPVRVEPENPSAIPVTPHRLRRSLVEISDQWDAHVGLANGQLNQGHVDLPIIDFVYDLFGVGAEGLRERFNVENFTAHDVWPFVGASLLRQGIAGPYWFLVRTCADYGQLLALLRRVYELSNLRVADDRLKELLMGIESIDGGVALPAAAPLATELVQELEAAEGRREALASNLARCAESEKALPAENEGLVLNAAEGKGRVGEALDQLLENGLGLPEGQPRQYWARVLAESALDPEDRTALVGVLAHQELNQAHTAARKALRRIDAAAFGPQIEV